jgi:hypothetical protein
MTEQALRATALACACACVCVNIAQAQTTGTIVGTVTDASTGSPVARATVVARSPGLQGEQTAVADETGGYRLSLLPPGSYEVSAPALTASAPGAEAARYARAERAVVVHANRTVRADLALAPASVRLDELVVRSDPAPAVDIGTAEGGTVLTRDFLETVPLARDFADAARVAPGAQPDPYGVAFGGASSPENAYLLDGMDVTDPAFGTQGSRLLTNFVEEVDVRSSSFMPERGRATGGVVQAITRSGSNEFHGSVFGSFQPGALSPAARAFGRDAQAIIFRERRSSEYRADFGLELGGPVVKDRLWFYFGFAPVLNHLVAERSFQALREDPTDPGGALRDPASGLAVATRVGPTRSYGACTDTLNVDCNRSGYQLLGKLSYLAAEDHQLGLTFYTAPEWREYLDSSSTSATDSAGVFHDSRRSTDVAGRYAGKLLDKRLLVEAQAGWHHQTQRDDPLTIDGIDQAGVSAVRWTGTHSLRDFFSPEELGEAYAACAPTATFDPCPVSRFLTGGRRFLGDATLDRLSGKLSASGLFTALGHHQVKVGLELERSTYANTSSWGGGVYLAEAPSATYGATFVDYRDYGRITSPTDPNLSPDAQRFTSLRATTVSNGRAVYLQDSWSFLDAVTLNFGVRWDTQEMFLAGAGGEANLDITGNIAPRVQAIWDFTGRGRGAIKASWGRFYESIPLDLGDRQFSGATQILSTRAYCVGPSPTVGGSPARCSRIPDATYNGALGRYTNYAQLGGAVTPVAPDLQGQYVDMFGASIEYEILPDLSAGLFYEGRRLGRVVEDMSADDGATFFIANPGESKPFALPGGSCAPGGSGCVDPRRVQATDPVTLRSYTASIPRPERSYDAFTVELRKVFGKRWLALASYRYSILRGNYAGLFSPETGQLDPNVLPEYDLASLLPNRSGPLPGDVPHQIKLFGSYLLPISPRLSLHTGLALRLQSGAPVSYLGAHPIYGAGQTYILPRGSAGRTPWLTSLDLRARVDWLISRSSTFTLSVDVFNVLNAQEPVAVDQNYTYDSVQPVVGGGCRTRSGAEGAYPLASAAADCPDLRYLRTTDHRPVTPNPNFGRAIQYQAPRAVRFGMAISF